MSVSSIADGSYDVGVAVGQLTDQEGTFQHPWEKQIKRPAATFTKQGHGDRRRDED